VNGKEIMDETKYSYGYLNSPTQDDAQFESESDAARAAVERSIGWHSHVYGVWQNGTGEVLAIVYAGQIYRPE
jgi:hypothetical protein